MALAASSAMVSAMNTSADRASIFSGLRTDSGKSLRFSVTIIAAWVLSAAARTCASLGSGKPAHAGSNWPKSDTQASSKATDMLSRARRARAAASSRPLAVSILSIARSVSSNTATDHRTLKKPASARDKSKFRLKTLASVQASMNAVNRLANTFQISSASTAARSSSALLRRASLFSLYEKRCSALMRR